MKSNAQILWVGMENPIESTGDGHIPGWDDSWVLHWIACPRKALSAARLPDLVVIDVPVMETLVEDVIRQFRDSAPVVPVLVHNEFATVAEVVSYVRAGAADVAGPGSDLADLIRQQLGKPLHKIPRKLPPAL